MTNRLILTVSDAEQVVEALPDVGLTGVRMPDSEGRQQVQVVPYFEYETPEDLWFELSGYRDRLGIIYGQSVDIEDAPPAGENRP